jgi:hypothetical protein
MGRSTNMEVIDRCTSCGQVLDPVKDHNCFIKNINRENNIMKEEKEDAVNHPKHYIQGKWEVHEIITGMGMTDWREANILKYSFRYKYKKGTEDLKKIKWYLEKLINDIESGNTEIVNGKLIDKIEG